MKVGFLILSVPLIFLSCTKTTSTGNPTGPTRPTGNPTVPTGNPVTNTGLPVSVTEYKPGAGISGQRIITEFTYDANQWPSTITMHSFDTSGTIPYIDSFRIVFVSSGTDSPPREYDITWMVGTAPPEYGATEHHLLYYDGQNRVIEDSASTTNWLDLTANTFTYDGDHIIEHKFDNSPQVFNGPFTIDTVVLSASNISRYTNLYTGGSDPEFVEMDGYTPSTFANPLYQSKVANSLGAMLRFTVIGFGYIGDFISPRLMSQWSYTPVLNRPPVILYYTWTTDSSGRVVLGTGKDSFGSGAGDIFTFAY